MRIRLRVLLLGGIAVAAILYLATVHFAGDVIDRYTMARTVARQARVVDLASDVVHQLQRERGRTAGFLARPAGENRRLLKRQYRRTDSALAALRSADARGSAAGRLRRRLHSPANLRRVVLARRTGPAAAHHQYTRRVDRLMTVMADLARAITGAPALRRAALAHRHLMVAKEHLGQIRAVLTHAFARGRLERDALLGMTRHRALMTAALDRFRETAAPPLRRALNRTYTGPAVVRLAEYMEAARNAGSGGRMDGDPHAWFRTATTAIDRLKAAEDAAVVRIRHHSAAIRREARRAALINGGGTAAVLALLLFLGLSIARPMLRGIEALTESIAGIRARRDFSLRVPEPAPLELRTVARGFNDLLTTGEHLIREKEYYATTDPLTGTWNRMKFFHIIEQELARARRHHRPLALLFFDIDHFKRINDAHGHAVGDAVLTGTCRVVLGLLRRTDALVRWGGEEFVVVATETDRAGATALAGRLRAAVAGHTFPEVGRVTVSFGVTAHRCGDTTESIVQRADDALYRAKEAGRDRVMAE